MRKLSWTLLLPFLMLFAQQGGLQHSYSHDRVQASSSQKAPVDADHCLQCLGYAQIASLAKADFLTPALLAGLSFRLASSPRLASAENSLVPPRSRGPPTA